MYTCTNADSLTNKRNELEVAVASDQPDIIAVTEVLLKCKERDIQKSELLMEGYDCYFSGEGRGVCIYTKKWLNAIQVDDLTDMDFKESIWCETRLSDEDNLMIGCVYRSPNSPDENNAHLWNLLNAACAKQNSHLLIMGDFNFPEIDWDSWTSSAGISHASNKLLDCLQDNYLFQEVRCFNRYREGQQPSHLDLVIVNEEELIDDITEHSAFGKSDHIVLQFELNCHRSVSEDQPARFLYAKGDYSSLKNDLKEVNWTELKDLDITKAWDILPTKLRKRWKWISPNLSLVVLK